MKRKKRGVSLIVSLAMLMQSPIASAYSFSFDKLNDGAVRGENTIVKEFKLLDAESGMAVATAGLQTVTEIKKDGRSATALWENHEQMQSVSLAFPKNVLDYSYLEINYYAPEAYGNTILIYFESAKSGYGSYKFTVDKAGWTELKINVTEIPLVNTSTDLKSIRKAVLYAGGGWGLEPHKEAKIYFQDIKLVDDGSRKSSEEAVKKSWDVFYQGRTFDAATQETAKKILENTVAVHKNTAIVSEKGKHGFLSDENQSARMETIGGVDMVPVKFFSKYFGVQIKDNNGSCEIISGTDNIKMEKMKKEYTINGEEKIFSQSVCTLYGELYVPLCDLLELLKLDYKMLDKTYLIGEKEMLDTIRQEYEISECISYGFKNDNIVITDADYEKAIENIIKMYTGNNNDLSNPDIAEWVRGVEATGMKWYNEMITDPESAELWADIPQTMNRGLRSQTYAKRITEMAKAWGTKGTLCYQSNSLLEKTLFALEYFHTNIYNIKNPELLNQTGGWFYWYFATPNELLPGLFILSDILTDEYMARYLETVDYINPSSVGGTQADQDVFADESKLTYSGNKCWKLRIALWSAILQKQPERIKQEVNLELRRLFEYTQHVDNGKFHESVPTNWNNDDSKNNGFYADGSYVDHMYYPYIAGYGANYFGVMATVFRSLKDTSMFPTDPIIHNQVDWMKNALAPLVWKNNIYWRTKGRNIKNEGAVASTRLDHFVGYYLDMLDYLSGDDREFVKSLIKTQGQYMDTTGAMQTTGDNIVLFKEILNDSSIPLLEDEDFSKVFFNMAAAAHQRDDYKFYLTMNSTEIGYAEIYTYSGENFYGFHQSDGHISLLTDDGTQYDGSYWNNANPARLAGVTSIERPFDYVTGSICYAGTDFVGGATLDNKYTVAAMDFYGHNRGQVTREDNKTDAYYSDLAAHKSWFMFDDEIVCLGSGITNSENYEAITTIESRRLDGRTELKTESTVEQYDAQSVSACGDDGNSPENTIDYNYSTRWSYEGTDGWIEYDLGEAKDIGYIGIAFYAGKSRKTKIKILTSEDKVSWSEHFNGTSSGTTDDIEVFSVNEKVRYVKLECYGNTSSNWNSICEVQFYPKRNDEQMPVNQKPPYIFGTTDVWADGTLLEKTDFADKKAENVSYVNIDGVGGYYFPQPSTLVFNKYTKGSVAVMDFYTSHGVNPADEKYAYAILPAMTKEETESYAKNPRFTILKNEKNIQSVKHNDLGITGTVFWEKGETDTLSTDIACVVNMYRDENTVRLAIADPSKLEDGANIKVKIKNLTLKKAGECISVEKDAQGYQNIKIDFSVSNDPAFKGQSYRGNTYIVEFTTENDDKVQP